MRFAPTFAVAISLIFTGEQGRAQTQPPTIPTAVAQAMSFTGALFGKTQYFDGRTPPDWPAVLVPPGVTVLGGGAMGDSAMLRVLAAVFSFPERSNPSDVLQALLAKAGYTRYAANYPHSGGGFVATEPSTPPTSYCKGSTLATFEPVDSADAPLVIAVHLVHGDAGRQTCSPQPDRPAPNRFPITVPTLVPPRGVIGFASGSSWGDSGGNTESTLRTTMPVDSILLHYTRQLVAGGWTSQGRPTIGDGVGVQRFSFREGQESWQSALIIMEVGDRREVLLRFTRAQ